MCGITAVLSADNVAWMGADGGDVLSAEELERAKIWTRRRGPDASKVISVAVDKSRLDLEGNVLNLRGCPTAQPLQKENNALLWNGEVFGNDKIKLDTNDTKVVLDMLYESGEGPDAVKKVIGGIHGPFSFIYWEGKTCTLYYGRDRLGRRSLVRHTGRNKMVLSSVSGGTHSLWEDVPTGAIFSITFGSNAEEASVWTQSIHMPWEGNFLGVRPVPVSGEICWDDTICSRLAQELLALLDQSVWRRVHSIPKHGVEDNHAARVAIMFSGGLDSMILTLLAHKHIPISERIDLLNVAYGDFPDETPDRIAGWNGLLELRDICPDREFRLIEVDITYASLAKEHDHITGLVCPSDTVMDANIGSALWYGGRGCGIIRNDVALEYIKSRACRYACDSNDEEYEENGLVVKHAKYEKLLKALKKEGYGIHVPLSSLGQHGIDHKQQGVRQLSYFVGMAEKEGIVHTGGRGTDAWVCIGPKASCKCAQVATEGQKYNSVSTEEVRTEARVLLMGMGADELMCGYARYRTRFRKGGWEELERVMQTDFDRLWRRNLGRDDRVLGDHGREARFPFLDEDFVSFVRSLPLQHICNPREELGIGDKKILRLAARTLGMTRSSFLQKRAIQFGTRIASRKQDGKSKMSGTTKLSDITNPLVMKKEKEKEASTSTDN